MPVAILFGGVLITIMIGLHVVLFSMAETAVQAAADRGVNAAQAAQLGGAGVSSCGTLTEPFSGQSVSPTSERQCQGVIAAWQTLNASTSMVRQVRPPAVAVDEVAGVVSVTSFGAVISPVFGPIEVAGIACGPLDLVEGDTPTRADPSAC